jgi:hypothetical protein
MEGIDDSFETEEGIMRKKQFGNKSWQDGIIRLPANSRASSRRRPMRQRIRNSVHRDG